MRHEALRIAYINPGRSQRQLDYALSRSPGLVQSLFAFFRILQQPGAASFIAKLRDVGQILRVCSPAPCCCERCSREAWK